MGERLDKDTDGSPIPILCALACSRMARI